MKMKFVILLFVFCSKIFASVEVSKTSVFERTFTAVSFSREDPDDVDYGTSLYIQDGYLLTALHVVRNYEMRTIGVEKGEEKHLAPVAFLDEKLDMALLHSDIEMEPLDLVFEMPALLDMGFIFWCPGPDGIRASSCEISRLHYDFIRRGELILGDTIGYNGFMFYGASGGLVFNENGNVAGMVNLMDLSSFPELFGVNPLKVKEFLDRILN